MDMNHEEINSPGSSSCNFEEGGRGCRTKKKQNDPSCCPVCSVTLRQQEIDSHLNSEIEKLNKLPSSKHKLKNISPSSSNGSSSNDNNQDKNWETFQKVRLNRQGRQKTKTRKRRAEETCPICNKEVSEDLTLHVELCLRRSEANGSESDENIDVEGYEEYEWAGQSRVRVTSLLQGGVSSLGTTISMAEEDEDLNVDGDDTQTYGSPQYSETDVILPCGDPENVALRKAVTGADPKRLCADKNHSNDFSSVETKGDPVLEVLKNRIRELESREQNREEVYKCLICMERYRTPVISVCCWHVHCEECWLQTLGAKKLCPQCNMITSPADLRKIYM
ncbi:hypothetical protein NQ315_010400 [Exocentrus adspersus]|uniref:RING-type domain-containing protein n=1 Tax=Exocentrus adspersus TaxID=1586481 RepID=A0AAV8WB90_9CUCU|nr:hypothetical protein NQ315_010400 [Exocentrus adspersus]